MPLMTLFLVALNVLAYRLELASGGVSFCYAHGLVPVEFIRGGAPETLVTSLFLHDPNALVHIVGNMAFLLVFGTIVERALGSLGFAALYLVAGIVGGLMHVLVAPGSAEPLVGASGAIFGVLAMAAVLRPRLLGFVGAFVGLNIVNALTGGDAGVSFGCHIGGFFVGVAVAGLLRMTGSEALELV